MSVEVVPQALAYNGEEDQSVAGSTPVTQFASAKSGTSTAEDEPAHTVLTLFASGSEQILLQDSVACADEEHNGAPRMPIALVVPYLYFARHLGDLAGNDHADNDTQ